jgi:hypothetical protein
MMSGNEMLDSIHQRVRAALDVKSTIFAPKSRARDRQAEAVMVVLEDAALDQMTEHLLAECRFRAMEIREGKLHLDATPARELTAQWIGAARTMLGDAENYIEMDVTLAETGEGYTFHLSRREKLTPHRARQIAEAERDELRAKLFSLQAQFGRLADDTLAESSAIDPPADPLALDSTEDAADHARAVTLRELSGKIVAILEGT